MRNLENKNVRNGALVAMDYQTGELVAYVGSAKYYATNATKKFQPQYDVVGHGFRQPGSAFKPFNYAAAIDDRKLTAGSMLMDSATDFGGGYTPGDADHLERGPVRVRNALQFSLNIPSVKTTAINGVEHVFDKAKDFGMTFQTETSKAGLALGLGVQEVRPVDLVTAYSTLANEGRDIGHTTILKVQDTAGNDVLPPYSPPKGTAAVSPQSAFIVTDILAGNTNPNVNPYWGRFAINSPDGRRPATLKTGTNNDAKDLNAYGYIAPPTEKGRADGAYALTVGVWNGNSDNTPGLDRRPTRLLHRCLDLRVGRLPPGGEPPVAGHQVRASRRSRAGIDRPVDRTPVQRQRLDQGVVHRRDRASGHGPRRHVRHRGRPHRQRRDRTRRVDARQRGLDQTRRERAGHARRTGQHEDLVFLQRGLQALRLVVGRARRGPRLRSTDPIAHVLPAADTGREWGDPVDRTHADAFWFVRAGDPVRDTGPVGLAIGHAAAIRYADPIGDPDSDTGAHTDADARAHAHPNAHAHADPDTDPVPTPTPTPTP